MEEQKRNPAAGLSESEQVQVRRQKLADLRAAGSDPFVITKYKGLDPEVFSGIDNNVYPRPVTFLLGVIITY